MMCGPLSPKGKQAEEEKVEKSRQYSLKKGTPGCSTCLKAAGSFFPHPQNRGKAAQAEVDEGIACPDCWDLRARRAGRGLRPGPHTGHTNSNGKGGSGGRMQKCSPTITASSPTQRGQSNQGEQIL